MKITWEKLMQDIKKLEDELLKNHDISKGKIPVYGIPKNGMIIALLMRKDRFEFRESYPISPYAPMNTVIIDDLVGSGKTLKAHACIDPKDGVIYLSATLYRKPHSPKSNMLTSIETIDEWIEFPFEYEADDEDIMVRLIEKLGEDPTREGLKNTPERAMKAWKTFTEGYQVKTEEVMTTFENESKIDQIVGMKDIAFFSTCEHHLVPFFGKAHVFYVPNDKIIGISKLARIVDMFSRRLQNQERITKQVADALEEELKPKAVGVILEGQHLCSVARGVQKHDAVMKTSDLRGAFMDDSKAREELFSLIK